MLEKKKKKTPKYHFKDIHIYKKKWKQISTFPQIFLSREPGMHVLNARWAESIQEPEPDAG